MCMENRSGVVKIHSRDYWRYYVYRNKARNFGQVIFRMIEGICFLINKSSTSTKRLDFKPLSIL
jgi:hypothetical protein